MKTKLVVDSNTQGPFWVRVFRLEEEFESIRKFIHTEPEFAMASVPVINEYKAGQDLEFVYCLLFTVDITGPNHVVGAIYLCDESSRAEALEKRNELADILLKSLDEHHQAQAKAGKGAFRDVSVIEPKREE